MHARAQITHTHTSQSEVVSGAAASNNTAPDKSDLLKYLLCTVCNLIISFPRVQWMTHGKERWVLFLFLLSCVYGAWSLFSLYLKVSVKAGDVTGCIQYVRLHTSITFFKHSRRKLDICILEMMWKVKSETLHKTYGTNKEQIWWYSVFSLSSMNSILEIKLPRNLAV